jgi:hypothetical protein
MKRDLVPGAVTIRVAPFLVAVASVAVGACQAEDPVDLILMNGFVYTADREPMAAAAAVGVDDGKIVYVGNEDSRMRRLGGQRFVQANAGNTTSKS